MKNMILGLLVLASVPAFSQITHKSNCDVNVMVDEDFEYHDGQVCGGDCSLYEWNKERITENRKEKLPVKVNKMLQSKGLFIVEKQAETANATYSLSIINSFYVSDYDGVNRVLTLELRDQAGDLVEQTRETMVAEILNYSKQMKLLRRAAKKLKIVCSTRRCEQEDLLLGKVCPPK